MNDQASAAPSCAWLSRVAHADGTELWQLADSLTEASSSGDETRWATSFLATALFELAGWNTERATELQRRVLDDLEVAVRDDPQRFGLTTAHLLGECVRRLRTEAARQRPALR